MEEVLYDKYYYECFALLTLKYFWSGYEDGFENLDKPDLQNEKADIGIEVVQALSEEEGLYRSMLSKGYGTEETWEEEAAFEFQGDEYDNSKHIREIYKRFGEKLHKLNKQEDGYKPFSMNGIYIYAENSKIEKKDILEMQPRFEQIQSRYMKGFDIIFINAIDKMYEIKGNRDIMQIEYDEAKLKKIHREALIRSEIIRIYNI